MGHPAFSLLASVATTCALGYGSFWHLLAVQPQG